MVSINVTEVYLGETICNPPLDTLPFEEYKLPQDTKEAC